MLEHLIHLRCVCEVNLFAAVVFPVHMLLFFSHFFDCQNIFMQIFVWSMKTGRLLDILSGHQGPVHGLMFSPINVRAHVLFYPCFISCLSNITKYKLL